MFEDFYCTRCGKGFKWAQMHSTQTGNLFCPDCWPKLDVQNEPKRKCPVDGAEMGKHLIEDLILIDSCRSCGGTWFDRAELEVIKKMSKDAGWNSGFVLGWLVSIGC